MASLQCSRAFTGLKQPLPFRASVACFRGTSRARVGPRRLSIVNYTIWQLQPESKWCEANPDACEALQKTLDLTSTIGEKSFCTVGSVSDCDVTCALKALDTPIHIKFEAKGDHAEGRPLDSPCHLFLTDINSGCEVIIDGETLDKGEPREIQPGCKLAFGDLAVYQVMRNSFAHA
eukprot:jgi/Botrbrau1/2449/Bobra.0226s0008.1